MTAYAIIPATPAHIPYLAENMREVDRAEIWASGHETPTHSLEAGLEHSLLCWVALADGVPFCMFGVAPLTLLGGTGIVWMLGTDGMTMHKRAFLRGSRPVVSAMKKPFHKLENWVDARNSLTIRWLRWLDFTFEDAAPYGVEGLPFHHFWMER